MEIIAKEGCVWKNRQSGEVFGSKMYLSKSQSPSDFEEVSEELINQTQSNTEEFSQSTP
jgi:hypothetical protein